jgi:hypothetical protein
LSDKLARQRALCQTTGLLTCHVLRGRARDRMIVHDACYRADSPEHPQEMYRGLVGLADDLAVVKQDHVAASIDAWAAGALDQ